MQIPFHPDDTMAAYHRMLENTLDMNIPYMQTVKPLPDNIRHPVYFPGTAYPGIDVVPPMEYFAENVNNLIILEENCTAPLQCPEKCGILY